MTSAWRALSNWAWFRATTILLSALSLLLGVVACGSASDITVDSAPPTRTGPTKTLGTTGEWAEGNSSTEPSEDVAAGEGVDPLDEGQYYEWPDGGLMYEDPLGEWYYISPDGDSEYLNFPPEYPVAPHSPNSTVDSMPPTPSAASTPTKSVAQAILDQCLPGEIAFRPPSPMSLGETHEFVLRAVTNESTVDPKESFPVDPKDNPSPRPIETAHPKICDSMRADLSGPTFDIERAGSESGKMLVPDEGMAEWRWHITPKKAGTQKLTLQLFALGPGGEDITLKSYDEDIIVEVEFGHATKSFIKEWMIPLGITIPVVVAAIGAIVAWRRRRDHKPDRHPTRRTGHQRTHRHR